MKEDFLESLPQLLPIDFFSIECEVPYSSSHLEFPKKMEKHLLPDTSGLLHEDHFADVSLMWNEEAVIGEVSVNKAFEESLYPEVRKGDSIELFFDTRNIKTAGYATRFCHHFVILPVAVNGIQCKEITRFRSEDTHVIEETLKCSLETEFLKKSYKVRFIIPKESFCGYDPSASKSIGFTYRINRGGAKAQHFSVSSEYYSIEQQPSLWATLHLKK